MEKDRYQLAWYENLDGAGSFSSPRLIDNTIDSTSMMAADLDGDGDPDILVATGMAGQLGVAWYENTDGAGDFGPPRVIHHNTDDTRSVFAADLDGDGDLDVLSGSGDSNANIAWYENTDGQGNFGPPREIQPEAGSIEPVLASDLDNDGDLDVLSSGVDGIVWHENADGRGAFGPSHLVVEIRGPVSTRRSVSTADLDEDGDQDILAVQERTVSFYENGSGLSPLGEFGPRQVIATSDTFYAFGFHAADMDGDRDLDIISRLMDSGHRARSGLIWQENLLPHPGDANRDGRFDTADLVQVLEAGEYEDAVEDNSTWEEGDWNGDSDFDTADLVLALQTGLYEVKSGLPASKIAAAVDWLFSQDNSKKTFRAFVA